MEIAKKQRYLHLLQKVKENKTLSKAELVELNKYERQAAGKIMVRQAHHPEQSRRTAKTGITSKVQPKKKKRKAAATSKRVKKKAGKKKHALSKAEGVKKKGRPGRLSIRRRSGDWDSNAKT